MSTPKGVWMTKPSGVFGWDACKSQRVKVSLDLFSGHTRYAPFFKFAEVVAPFFDELAVVDSSAILVDCVFLALLLPRLTLALYILPTTAFAILSQAPFPELVFVLRFAVSL